MTMSDVFKVRFDGLEWWARDAFEEMAPDYQRVLLWPLVAGAPPEKHVGPSLCVPAHLVERVGDIPPEPPVGTVLWDDDDLAWVHERGAGGGLPEWWSPKVTMWSNWHALRHPLHPYPRAARDEIERLTAKVAEGQRLVEEMAPVLIERDVLTAQLADARNAGTDIAEERDVATAEIERLTVHLRAKDAHAVTMATQIKRLRAERDAAQSAHGQACAAADELQRRIDRFLPEIEDNFGLHSRWRAILRGEVDQ
jgi:hypothetical protein